MSFSAGFTLEIEILDILLREDNKAACVLMLDPGEHLLKMRGSPCSSSSLDFFKIANTIDANMFYDLKLDILKGTCKHFRPNYFPRGILKLSPISMPILGLIASSMH